MTAPATSTGGRTCPRYDLSVNCDMIHNSRASFAADISNRCNINHTLYISVACSPYVINDMIRDVNFREFHFSIPEFQISRLVEYSN